MEKDSELLRDRPVLKHFFIPLLYVTGLKKKHARSALNSFKNTLGVFHFKSRAK